MRIRVDHRRSYLFSCTIEEWSKTITYGVPFAKLQNSFIKMEKRSWKARPRAEGKPTEMKAKAICIHSNGP